MERELWSVISPAIRDVARRRRADAYHTHDHALIVRVSLWAALHDRPVAWACDRRHWDPRTCPPRLPSQPTMSRRLRTQAVGGFFQALGRRLATHFGAALLWLKILDGKALEVAGHSRDPDATWGPAGRRRTRGYKLHAVWAGGAMPLGYDVRPMHVNEKAVAAELIPQLPGGGYLLADGFYHTHRLHALAQAHQHQLLSPRPRVHQHAGLGHRPQHPARLRGIAMLEPDRYASPFGRSVYRHRRQIETAFGNLTAFAAGLTTHLPPWVRRLHRVRLWVTAKLLINAARIRLIHA